MAAGGICGTEYWRAENGPGSAHRSVLAVTVAGHWLVRTPTPSTVRVRASSLLCGGAVSCRGRSPARMPATSITNMAVTAPDRNAVITSVTMAELISPHRFRGLKWRCASRGQSLSRVPEKLVTATVGPGKGKTNNTVR